MVLIMSLYRDSTPHTPPIVPRMFSSSAATVYNVKTCDMLGVCHCSLEPSDQL